MNAKTSLLLSALLSLSPFAQAEDPGFTELFNGKDLTGWSMVHPKNPNDYEVRDGLLYSTKGCGANLVTDKTYANYVLRLEFRLTPGANNGVGLRFEREAHASYAGMEIQILDDTAQQYKDLRPAQYCGSIYDVFPAKRGSLVPVGEWNKEEITADGRHIKVVMNGETIIDADLDTVTDPAVLAKHTGLARKDGEIGLLGHNDEVAFRNIRIKELK